MALVAGRDVPTTAGYPAVSGNKRALLVGVSYKGTPASELTGTANDVEIMSRLLIDEFHFPEKYIVKLTEEWGAHDTPTKENILEAMRWLVEGCKQGDSLVFHFSGHGKQTTDVTGDELDSLDEALCPMDYKEKGYILDDDIKETIVKPLIQGVKLHAIIDTCHSGTMLDLRYLCRLNRMGICSRYRWDDQYRKKERKESATAAKGGHAISISGCKDYQTSVEPEHTSTGGGGGVMTRSFVEAVRSEPRKTYGELLDSMRVKVSQRLQPSDSGRGRCLLGSLAGCFRSEQEPQLCSSEKFDVYKEQFLL